MRRRLRCLLWRQWEAASDQSRKLRALGLDAERARRGASNWQRSMVERRSIAHEPRIAGQYFTRMGLVSLMDTHQRLQSLH